jgi:uncharacterized protein YjbI with pentapeptide repeats
MKTYSKEELTEIIAKHQEWLQTRFSDNPQGQRADLSGCNLRGSDLSDSDLRFSDLSGSDLSRANLSGSDLSRANLSGSNLSRANLSDSDLSRANLSDSDLSRANLSRANLSDSDLSRANLSGCKIYKTTGIIYIDGPQYPIYSSKHILQIGCQHKTHDEWLQVTADQAVKMGLNLKYYPFYMSMIKILAEMK